MSEQIETTVETTETAPAAPAASKRQMSFTVLEDGTIRADFGPELEALTLNPTEVPESLHVLAITDGLMARARGYTSKLVDADRTPENLRTAIAKAFTAFKAGVWKIERAASVLDDFSQEVRAAFLFRKTRAEDKGEAFTDSLAQVAEFWNALTDDQKKQVKSLPRYQLALAKTKAEDAAKKAEALAKKVATEEEDSPF